MKKIYLKLFFTIILTHYFVFSYASDNEDSECPKTFTQKRKPNHHDDLRVSKKFKVEATELSDLEKESENNDINSPFSSNFSESVSPRPSTPTTSEVENNIKASNLIEKALVKINLGEYKAAIRGYEQVLEIPGIKNELKASAYINQGFVKIHLGQYEAAILDQDNCLLLSEIRNDVKIIAYTNRSYARTALGQIEDAILDIEEILKFKNYFSSEKLLLIYDTLIQLYEKQLNKRKISLNLNIEHDSNYVWFDF